MRVCRGPAPSARLTCSRSGRTAITCSTRWMARVRRRPPPPCPPSSCCARVWARHFARAGDGPDNGAGVRLRPVQGRGPGDRVESPYDIDVRFRAKSGTDWTGYMIHLTETCDPDLPRLVVHTDTTPAT